MTVSGIGRADVWRYSALALPIAFAGFPLYVLASDHYATTHGVSLTLLGAMLLALRLFDAIIDPLIGVLSDRYRHASAWFMGFASIMLCAGIYGVFNIAVANPAVWFCICIAVAVMGYSILSINLNALGGLWVQTSDDQTRITTLREALGLVGLVIAVSLPSVLKQSVATHQVYLYFSLLLMCLMALAWVAFWPWLSARVAGAARRSHQSISLLAGVRSTSRLTRYFLGVYGLSMLASAIPAVLVIFFVRDLLGAEHLTGVFLLLYFLSGAAAMPLWKKASGYLGAYRAWMLAMLLAIVSFVWAFFLGAGDSLEYGLICVFSGFALGADLALPPAILAGHIHQTKSEAHAATHYALLALAAKLALALASAIALPMLGAVGFTPASSNSETALLFLSAAYAVIPCLLKLAAALMLWRIIRLIQKGATHEKNQSNHHSWSSHHA